MNEFVNPEIITDVQCDLCSQNNETKPSEALTNQVKSLNFGKVHFASVILCQVFIILILNSYRNVFVSIFHVTYGIPIFKK